jgi:hypothetical protein
MAATLLWLAALGCPCAFASYAAGELLVRFRPQAEAAAASLHQGMRVKVLSRDPATGLHRCQLPADLSVEEAARRYRGMAEVELAQPNYTYHALAEPNDADFAGQWELPRIGAPAAWDTVHDAPGVIIAVIDTGLDYHHPDIAANIWPQLGWNFIAGNADPLDDEAPYYHGTHVSGIIGALGDNTIGVAGVCWQVQIMALKVLGPDGTGTELNIAAAIHWAANHGASIINLSLGGDESGDVMDEAVRYAAQTGITVVCAAGNDSINNDVTPFYPAALPEPNIISVASTGHSDALSSFSNYGLNTTSLAAPGEDILSLKAGDAYEVLSGTSMAAPLVSGAAALLLAAHPDFDYHQVKGYLVRYCKAENLPVLSGGRLDLAASVAAAGSGLPWGLPVAADVTPKPATINLAAPKTGFNCLIDLPGYDAASIDPASLRLTLTDCPECNPATATGGAATTDGGLSARFKRSFLRQIDPGRTSLILRGSLRDGTPFVGSAVVNVWKPVFLKGLATLDGHGHPATDMTRGAQMVIDCLYKVDARSAAGSKVSVLVSAFGATYASTWKAASPGYTEGEYSLTVPADAPTGAQNMKVTVRLRKNGKIIDRSAKTVTVTVQ